MVSIDATSTERRTLAYLDAVATVTASPVSTLVNTHSHLDHTNGNCIFGSAVTIVGHDRCRADIWRRRPCARARGPSPASSGATIEKAPPTLTFDDRVTLWVDDLRCELRYVGTPAHTTNDVIVWLPERSVLFAGDLVFNGGTPFNFAGSISGARKVLADIKALDPDVIVPGHGDVCDTSVIDPIVAYLDFIAETARSGRGAGLTPLQAARRGGPRRIRRAVGPRADRGQPAPGLCRARRGRARVADRHGGAGRHGPVQRGAAPALPRLIGG